ncbi:1617_t:CDS:10 [Racocetra fulgida]|uniref:1617_t:CDS:1 n=1 Tax=Racocetra fulgida TaxID=60492 RepID=A0A9N8ZL99_9GLOM|nr:1617_t:CDS:10 [Racocetra fulgida]
MQSRGISNSPYSIFDQLTFSDDLFEEKDRVKSLSEKIEIVKQTVNKLDEEYGILSLTDIVWNHTACNSEWLQDHPEAGYNLVNSPHLIPAYELDTALLEYSENISSLGYKAHVQSEEDLKAIIEGVKQHVIDKIRLWEFYVIDVKEALSEFQAALDKNASVDKSLFENIDIAALSFKEQAKLLADKGLYNKGTFGQRFYKKINIDIALAFIERLIETEAKYESVNNDSNVSIDDSSQKEQLDTDKLENTKDNHDSEPKYTLESISSKNTLIKKNNELNKSEDKSEIKEITSEKVANIKPIEVNEVKPEGAINEKSIHEIMLNKFKAIINEVNLPFYKLYDDEVIIILENLWNRAKYLKLDPHGPNQKEITQRVPLVERYFTRIPLNEKTQKHPKGSLAVVNNGWIWNANPLQDFASNESFSYLRREDDSPWLWDHMTKYTVQLASLFHGIRIDNCHSTPLHVGQHLLDAARRVRPNLYVVAELFTGSEEMDIKFVNHLGINSLIREAMQAWDSHELSRLVHRHGGKPVDASTYTDVDEYSETPCCIVPLVGSNPHALFMDCTHDNETPHQKRTAEDSLSNGALVAMSSCAVGSVKGYDEIYPMTVDLVNETRPYKLYEKPLEIEFIRDDKYLTGLPSSLKALNAPILRELSDEHGKYTEVTLPKEFPSGSITLLKTKVDKHNSLDEMLTSGADEVFKELNLVDLNIVLYRCGSEENDLIPGHGTYNVPGYGDLPYCGLEGFMSVLRPIMKENDLGHPFCANLREGHWALDYVVDPIKRVMSQLSPCAYEGSSFIQSLALCSVQMYGIVLSTGLHPTEIGPSMAAGLPHFATAHMRCWGRDVFISLRGLFLTTGNFEAAKKHIIGFGSVLKHGMIPNLLDAARRPRYNCRDAPWWFLQSIQDYCKFSPEGLDFLKTPVTRRFPKNDEFIEADDPLSYKYESTILEIIQEIMERHACGIHFKEWNAGPNLDHAMTDKGFQIDIDVDWETGFLNGGNQWNCGTWMDKMGESDKAGNKGRPATPRDGAAVEIIGLLKSTLRWITELNKTGHYPWNGVELKGIYKDLCNSSGEYQDYQLRPNFPVAMVVAPELFDEHHALQALNIAREVLAGPLGMRTLDPNDLAYRGVYDNSNDGTDPSVAKGWNYHQGPKHETIHTITRHLLRHREVIETDLWAGLPELTNADGAFCPYSCPTQAWSAATLLDLFDDIKKLEAC